MKCPTCGSRQDRHAIFCAECGAVLDEDPAKNQPTSPKMKRTSGRRTAVLVVLGLAVIITGLAVAYTVTSSDGITDGLTGVPVDILIDEADASGHVLFDEQGVVVRFESFDSDEYFTYMDVSIENNSDSDINLQCEDVSVNGTMIFGTIRAGVASGEKQKNAVSFSTSELNNADITTIRDVELKFELLDPETYDPLYTSDVITITAANNELNEETDHSGGTVILEQDEYVIRYMGPARSRDIPEEGLCLLVENDSAGDIYVDVVNAYINGDYIPVSFYCRILAGKKSYENLTFLGGLYDYDTGEQNEIAFQLVIFDQNNYEPTLVSEVIHIII